MFLQEIDRKVVCDSLGRFVKSTHISMISNSVTHLQSYTNSTIADIAGNSVPILPETPHEHRYRRIEWQVFRDVSRCFKSVSHVLCVSWYFTSGSRCITMFYKCLSWCFAMFNNVLRFWVTCTTALPVVGDGVSTLASGIVTTPHGSPITLCRNWQRLRRNRRWRRRDCWYHRESDTHAKLHPDLFGNCLPGTELLQSPFTIPAASSPISAELSPISAELSPIPAVLRSCRDPWGDRRGRAITDAAMPIVARLTKHRKTLLNIVKRHETLLKHCEMS